VRTQHFFTIISHLFYFSNRSPEPCVARNFTAGVLLSHFSNRIPALCQAQHHDNMPAAPWLPIHDISQTIHHQPYDKQRS